MGRVNFRETTFIPQICQMQPDGLQTCYTTSILNGAIAIGKLSSDQAQQVQTLLTTEFGGGYESVVFPNGGRFRVWQGNPKNISLAVRLATGIELIIHEIDLFEYPKIEEPRIVSLIRQSLYQGDTVVGTWSNHARVGTRDLKNPNRLVVVDPLFPNQPYVKPIRYFAQKTLSGGFLSIVA